ncbi:Leucine-rich repeat - like 10 [Theobroma cacao]|nr:Leucine-rich repeat - like 10 [Theobroma cacao]
MRESNSYFDSSGVSGEIPSTFTNLQNLQTVWASDTELTGRIPDFTGNWSKLRVLYGLFSSCDSKVFFEREQRKMIVICVIAITEQFTMFNLLFDCRRFQGNSFEGPIPSTFSDLTSLTELRISGLSNGSSLSFIKDMKSLTILDLRNNNIPDTIPSTIGEYQGLTQLDLSFNNITGQIPDSLFNLNSLTHLFLGNNKLNGSLPAQRSSSLRNMTEPPSTEFSSQSGNWNL